MDQAGASLRHEAEGRLLSTPQGDPLIAPDEPGVRVVALVMVAGLVGLAGWLVAYAWWLFTDGLAGRVPMDKTTISTFLLIVVSLLPMIHRLGRVALRGVDPEPEHKVIDAVESRAFLEAVERHDRLLEAQKADAVKADGALNGGAHRPRLRGEDRRADEGTGGG